jgi:plasmid stabilization system protein ParE
MAIQWSDFALRSLEEIVLHYEAEGGRELANRAEMEIWSQVEDSNRFPEAIQESEIFPGTRRLVIRIFPYVVFIRKIELELWEVVDVVHTARMLPKGSA